MLWSYRFTKSAILAGERSTRKSTAPRFSSADVIYWRSARTKNLGNRLHFELQCWATTHCKGFFWAEFIADVFGTIWLLKNCLSGTNWIMSKNQLVPIRPLYQCQVFSNIAAMNSAPRNLQNEWSFNIVAQKEVDFPIYWCSDLQYITSAIQFMVWRSYLRAWYYHETELRVLQQLQVTRVPITT